MRLLLICITRFYWIFFFSFSPFVFLFVKGCLSFITAQTLSNVTSHERNFAHLFFDCVMFKLDCKLAVKPQCLSFFVGFVCHNECTSWTHKRLLLVIYKLWRHLANLSAKIQHVHSLQVSSSLPPPDDKFNIVSCRGSSCDEFDMFIHASFTGVHDNMFGVLCMM